MAPDISESSRAPLRVRFETRLRHLRVTHKVALSPHLLRIELTGDLSDFRSLGFDDHVKLFLPDPITGVLTLPDPGREPVAGAPRPIMRDYTPVWFDTRAGLIVLEFALHGTGTEVGPATGWALAARPGDMLTIGGPRGSQVPSSAFDAYLLIGDETALPAIGRRLREATAGTRFTVLAEVAGPEDHLSFETRADADIHWVCRAGSGLGPPSLSAALSTLQLPAGDISAWVACEAEQARQVRTILLARGLNPAWIKAAGYWTRGLADSHMRIE